MAAEYETNEKRAVPFDVVEVKLSKDDDPDLWKTALTVLADEFLQRYDHEAKNRDWVFIVGACSHWVRPHQTRWTAAGGFAWPQGYNSFSPELDWTAIFSVQNRQWTPIEKCAARKQVVLRVAIPTRTVRHKQAAVHTKWSTSQKAILYGFRNLNGSWKCVAASDEKLRGHIG